MSGKGFGLYDRSITVRVNGEQYNKYKEFCLKNRIQLNDLVRFLLDKTVAEDDTEFNKVMQRYECLNTLRLAEELFRGTKKKRK